MRQICTWIKLLLVEAVGMIDINAPIIDNLKAVAKAKNKDIEDVVAIVLNRPRHEHIIAELREAGRALSLLMTATLRRRSIQRSIIQG